MSGRTGESAVRKVVDPLLDVAEFSAKYVKLRVAVALGQYYTAEPLSISWRWRHWRHPRLQPVRQNQRRHSA